jgi:hypothetical protein
MIIDSVWICSLPRSVSYFFYSFRMKKQKLDLKLQKYKEIDNWGKRLNPPIKTCLLILLKLYLSTNLNERDNLIDVNKTHKIFFVHKEICK